jgi:hypothetical protein
MNQRWLATDVSKERLRHVANGKKISRMMEVYEQSKSKRKAKQVKDVVAQNKKLASKMAKDVSQFWTKINKVIAFKQKSEADDARQKAMDKHLVFLVKQTERYTSLLADNLESGGAVGMNIPRSPKTARPPRSPRASPKLNKNKRTLQEATHDEEDIKQPDSTTVNTTTSIPDRKRRSTRTLSSTGNTPGRQLVIFTLGMCL